MPNEETTPEGEQAQQITEEVQQPEAEPQDDYRAKLNATNRFLEKEGYEFKENRWVRNTPPPQPAPSHDGLSVDDTIYVAKADIHADDVKEVLTYSKKMGVSVKDAHDFYKPILKQRQEERTTAQATATGRSRPAPSKVSDDSILANAVKGNLPEDDDGISRLVEAEMAKKLKK